MLGAAAVWLSLAVLIIGGVGRMLSLKVEVREIEILVLCMHDPAWWWVKASNLGTLSGVAVRFGLACD